MADYPKAPQNQQQAAGREQAVRVPAEFQSRPRFYTDMRLGAKPRLDLPEMRDPKTGQFDPGQKPADKPGSRR